MKKLLTFAALALISTAVSAQKNITEGMVIYQVEWKLPEQMQQMSSMFPKEITVYFKGDSSVTQTKSSMSSSNSIMNAKTEYQRLLLDVPMMGKKYSVIFTPDDLEQIKENWPDLTLKEERETKTIAGYNGRKYTVTEKKSATTSDAWFSKDLQTTPNSLTQFFDASYGFPLQFHTYQNGMGLDAVVKEIKEGPVPAGSFSAGKNYEEITFTQLMSMMGARR